MKNDKKSLVHGMKAYNLIMSNVWQLLTILLIGILVGYLLTRNATNKKINYMAISIIVFAVIGIIVFFVNIIREAKKMEQIEMRKKAKIEQENNNQNTEDKNNSHNEENKLD